MRQWNRVDELLLNVRLTISAIGDCAHFPHAALGMRTRLESVQNAVDQGRSSPRVSWESQTPIITACFGRDQAT